MMNVINIETSKPYDVIIGNGLLNNFGEILSEKFDQSKIVLVTDSNVDRIYSQIVKNSLIKFGFTVFKYVFAAGEKSKNIKVLSDILEFMAESGISRADTVVALGGGVVGDIAGFAASVYLRGVKFIQIPTTLLAAVDSSIGGKTAINLESGKNLAGSFWQPSLAVCDSDIFKRANNNILLDGMSEVIKYAVISDKKFFDYIVKNHRDLDFREVISKCIKIKRDFVIQDEFDLEMRQLLNFGHTIGHAIEKCSDFEITHGKAIAIGMVTITKIAYKLGICKRDCVGQIVDICEKFNLPTMSDFSSKELTERIGNDKKRVGSEIKFIVPEEIGKVRSLLVNKDDVKNFIELGIE